MSGLAPPGGGRGGNTGGEMTAASPGGGMSGLGRMGILATTGGAGGCWMMGAAVAGAAAVGAMVPRAELWYFLLGGGGGGGFLTAGDFAEKAGDAALSRCWLFSAAEGRSWFRTPGAPVKRVSSNFVYFKCALCTCSIKVLSPSALPDRFS